MIPQETKASKGREIMAKKKEKKKKNNRYGKKVVSIVASPELRSPVYWILQKQKTSRTFTVGRHQLTPPLMRSAHL